MLACATLSFAQESATVAGSVTDPQGAGVPNALVTLYARARPTLRIATTTDAVGAYRFAGLTAGEYFVETEATGFAPASARELRIESNSGATLDISLEIAGVREQVVVIAASTPQSVDEASKSRHGCRATRD